MEEIKMIINIPDRSYGYGDSCSLGLVGGILSAIGLGVVG
jgi:hypothetical protein